MDQAEVLQKLQHIFNNIFMEPVVLTPTLTAAEVEEWDSLMHISLVVSVEKAFKVKFRVGEVENTKNVGDFAKLISQRLACNS